MEISGKTALITGGASGLGRATTERFVGMGARVAILDRDEKKGRALAKALGDGVMFCATDVTDEASVQAALSQVMERFGALHICCNFAGIGNAIRTLGKKGPFPLEEFQRIIQVNLVGTFNVLRLAAEQMAKHEPEGEDGQRGVIINTASIAAYEGQIGQAAYSASKGGIVGMTLPVARDLARVGIRVNTIVPGLVATPLMMGGAEEMSAEIAEFLRPLSEQVLFPKRFARPGEIAHLAASIVENDYINGECIRIDGGIRMQPK